MPRKYFWFVVLVVSVIFNVAYLLHLDWPAPKTELPCPTLLKNLQNTQVNNKEQTTQQIVWRSCTASFLLFEEDYLRNLLLGSLWHSRLAHHCRRFWSGRVSTLGEKSKRWRNPKNGQIRFKKDERSFPDFQRETKSLLRLYISFIKKRWDRSPWESSWIMIPMEPRDPFALPWIFFRRYARPTLQWWWIWIQE